MGPPRRPRRRAAAAAAAMMPQATTTTAATAMTSGGRQTTRVKGTRCKNSCQPCFESRVSCLPGRGRVGVSVGGWPGIREVE